ncbi:hypothetical protein JCM19231_747 [Vibrio ishigakensis]|uniref:Uncharacterized protein n=1 Tax=Vibrio ishigakensis TaxID=1481914 RepID=A0A0B8NX43_9VIBR|nr:hypothetical protein JCM19231_747 [Vibrio ishigakensis]
MLREGAEFLMEYRTDQLHNHEMKINATIGVIGMILDEQSYLDFALNTDYGIHYQLNHGATPEGMWFEGSIHYHYYALQALLNFEKLACGTPYSVMSNPNFLKMLKFPLNLVLNTGSFPRLNDCIAGQEQLTHAHLFEFAYREAPCDLFASALASIYQNISRDNIDALLYGVETLPEAKPLTCHSIHTEQAGISIEYNQQTNNAVLFKHAPYGGEHDHYDRLGLLLTRNGKEILPDLGTTGYGAELHYGYYKNTATHNTLVVNQQNQSPINPELNSYQKESGYTLIDASVDWSKPAASVDSHTIEQWDSDSYKDVLFRRILLVLDHGVVELNSVENPYQQQLDLTYHVRGEHDLDANWQEVANPLTGPLARMTDTKAKRLKQFTELNYHIQGDADFQQSIWTSEPAELLSGYAPDNPATSDLAYTLVRSKAKSLNCVVLHDLSCENSLQISDIEWQHNQVGFTLISQGEKTHYRYDLNSCCLELSC